MRRVSGAGRLSECRMVDYSGYDFVLEWDTHAGGDGNDTIRAELDYKHQFRDRELVEIAALLF
jgi:hypothetical protein